ncbi:MAG: hypothetical protein HOJ35_06770 [Bdellovibrionales bacterium]|nr:hypothetical protein [Bdellovibrionales bacterium]
MRTIKKINKLLVPSLWGISFFVLVISAISFKLKDTEVDDKIISINKYRDYVDRINKDDIFNIKAVTVKHLRKNIDKFRSEHQVSLSNRNNQEFDEFLSRRGAPAQLEKVLTKIQNTFASNMNSYILVAPELKNEILNFNNVIQVHSIYDYLINKGNSLNEIQISLKKIIKKFSILPASKIKTSILTNSLFDIAANIKLYILKADYQITQFKTVKNMENYLESISGLMIDGLTSYTEKKKMIMSSLLTFCMLVLSMILLPLVYFSIKRFNHENKTRVIKEKIKVRDPVLIKEKQFLETEIINLKKILGIVQSESVIPSAFINNKGIITWATNSFYQSVGDNNNWNDLSKTSILHAGGAHHIKNSVKLKNDIKNDYLLFTKEIDDLKYIEMPKMYSFAKETEKSLTHLTSGVLSNSNLNDMGALIENSLTEMSYLFQVSKLRINIIPSNILLVSFDEKRIKKGLSTLLSGLVLYLNSIEGEINVQVEYSKVSSNIFINLKIPTVKVQDVSSPMRFRKKVYPSLATYLMKVESILENNSAEISVKNMYNGTNDMVEGQISVKLLEDLVDKTPKENLKDNGKKSSAIRKVSKELDFH